MIRFDSNILFIGQGLVVFGPLWLATVWYGSPEMLTYVKEKML